MSALPRKLRGQHFFHLCRGARTKDADIGGRCAARETHGECHTDATPRIALRRPDQRFHPEPFKKRGRWTTRPTLADQIEARSAICARHPLSISLRKSSPADGGIPNARSDGRRGDGGPPHRGGAAVVARKNPGSGGSAIESTFAFSFSPWSMAGVSRRHRVPRARR